MPKSHANRADDDSTENFLIWLERAEQSARERIIKS